MDISIQVIPNDQHRPGITGADWFWDEAGNLHVKVSKLSDWRREIALGMHEAAEAILCKHNGVTQKSVDEFDAKWEKEHPAEKIAAGDQSDSPYRREHGFATAVERILASELGIDWNDYDEELNRL